MADDGKLSAEDIRKRQMVVTCRGCFAVLSAEDAEPETRRTGYCGVCRSRTERSQELATR